MRGHFLWPLTFWKNCDFACSARCHIDKHSSSYTYTLEHLVDFIIIRSDAHVLLYEVQWNPSIVATIGE